MFRHRNYRIYFVGQLASLIGTWMQMVALQWLVYRLTGSAIMLGVVTFAEQMPIFLLAMIGGLTADRVSRRSILLTTQTLMLLLSVILAALTLTGAIRFEHVLVLAALFGLVNAFDMPAGQAFVTELVPPADIPNAVGFNSALLQVARTCGPALAGLIIAARGEAWCFAVNGLTFVVLIVSLLLLRVRTSIHPSLARGARSQIGEAVRYVVAARGVRAVMALSAAVVIASSPSTVLMPVVVKTLGGESRALGLLVGSAGVGAFCGALSLALRRRPDGLNRRIAFSTGVLSCALMAFAMMRGLYSAALTMVVVGFALTMALSSSIAFIQAQVPNALRGRVNALFMMIFMGSAPLGALLSGAAASAFGARPTFAVAGACGLLAAAIFARSASRMPQLADIEGQGKGPASR